MATRVAVVIACWPGIESMLLGRRQREALASVADLVDDAPLGRFDDERAAALLARAEVLLTGWGCPRLDAAALERAPRLALVAHAAGTVKDLVTPAVWDRGIRVTSAAAANAVPVAEYTLAAILLANKRAFWADHRYRRTGEWPGAPLDAGNAGKRVGIVGASFVGRRVVELLQPFDLEVVVSDPYLDASDADVLGVGLVDLDELLRTSDVVSLHVPLLPETERLVGAEELARMRDGATLVNTARGRVVDTAALVAEVRAGRLYAVIDTMDPEPLPAGHPLLELDGAFVTPHLAGSTGAEVRRMADLAVDEIRRHARGEPPRHEVTADDLGRIA